MVGNQQIRKNNQVSTLKTIKKKCNECNKKLNIVSEYLCKCDKILCSKHKYSDTHKCSYNHKEVWKQIIRKKNPTICKKRIPGI